MKESEREKMKVKWRGDEHFHYDLRTRSLTFTLVYERSLSPWLRSTLSLSLSPLFSHTHFHPGLRTFYSLSLTFTLIYEHFHSLSPWLMNAFTHSHPGLRTLTHLYSLSSWLTNTFTHFHCNIRTANFTFIISCNIESSPVHFQRNSLSDPNFK